MKSKLILLALSSLVLAGCGSNDNPPSTSGEEGNLNIQVYVNNDKKVSDAWTTLANDFINKTKINVRLTIGSQVNVQMASRWKGDNPPDMVWIAGNGIADADLAKTGKFLDLKDWIEEGKVFGSETKIKDAINTDLITDYSGHSYELPILSFVQGLYYDSHFFAEKGYKIPKNYDELKAVSEEAKTHDHISALTYPGKYAAYLLWGLMMPAYAAYGDAEFFGKVCSADDPSVYDDERFASVLTRWKEYAKDHLLVGSTTSDHTSSQNSWSKHQALFIGNGQWLESEVGVNLSKEFKMDYINSPFIEASQKETAVMLPMNMAVASKSKNHDSAKKFLSYLYTQESQKTLASAYTYFSALKDFDYSSLDVSACAHSTYEAVKNKNVRLVNKNKDWDKVGDTFNNCLNKIAEGSMSVPSAVSEIKAAAARKNNK